MDLDQAISLLNRWFWLRNNQVVECEECGMYIGGDDEENVGQLGNIVRAALAHYENCVHKED